MYFIFPLSAISGFVTILAIIIKKNSTCKGILPSLIFILSIMTLLPYLNHIKFFEKHTFLIGTTAVMIFIVIPLLYLYTAITSGLITELRKIHLLHTVPFIQDIAFFLPFFMLPGEMKLEIINSPFSKTSMVIISTIHFYRLVYGVITLKTAKKAHIRQRNYLLIISYLNLFFTLLSTISLPFLFKTNAPSLISPLLNFNWIMILLVIIFFYWRKPEVLFKIEAQQHNKKEKYASSNLSRKDMENYFNILNRYMENEKPYKLPDFTLRKAAEAISVLPNHLSQTVNETKDMNFSRFINTYRINEAKRMLASPEYWEKSILEIAYPSGFKSKSAFNTAFKSITGFTPSQFKEKSLSRLKN